MTILEIALLVALIALAGVSGGVVVALRGRVRELAKDHAELTGELATAAAQVAELQRTAEARLRSTTEAETRLTTVEEELAKVARQRDGAFADRTAEAERRQQAEKQAALADQARTEMAARIADWEAVKAQHLEAAKAAMLETSTAMSSKLLEDHKREAEAQKKDSAELVKQTTEGLTAHFGKIVDTVSALHSQVAQTSGQAEQIVRALSNPAGAGHYAEIGLENMLREFGLEAGRDFIMQHTIEGAEDGSRLRPDAVVFLPGNTVLTIDSKASKFLLEAAEAEGTDGEGDAYDNLARTMNLHLKALSSKDYAGAIQATYRKAGRGDRIARAINIMYLPTEAGVERLCRADRQFQKKAVAANIVVAGPTGLMSYIGFARIELDLGRQVENQEKIVFAARQLIDAVSTVVGHVAGVGRGIKAAADSHAKLVGSVNARLLPRQRALNSLGLRQSGQKEAPAMLPSVQIVTHDDAGLIEGESEDVSPVAELTSLKVVRE